MRRFIVYSLGLVGILVSGDFVYADHDKSCQNVHGKVAVVTEDGITVDDKMYKVGKTTRITKGAKVAKLHNISAGDMVCLDARGKDDIGGGEVAAVAVLTVTDSPPVREKEYIREKETVRQISHNKDCDHLHGKVTRIEESTIMIDGQPHTFTTTTLVTKDGKTTKIETLKAGDFVCLDEADEKVTSVVVLSPPEAAPFQSREIVREKIREQKPAEHDKSCKNVHGKVTVVTEDGITLGDKLYKVGKSTRVTKGGKVAKLHNISAGDLVCLDARGKDDIGGGEIASVAVLTVTVSPTGREKEVVREKETVRQTSHDKSCDHLHGKVTRIEESTIMIDGQPHTFTTTTLVTKDGKTTKIETLKAGDFVCLDEANEKVTSVVVLSPPEAAPFQSREIIRERIREEK